MKSHEISITKKPKGTNLFRICNIQPFSSAWTAHLASFPSGEQDLYIFSRFCSASTAFGSLLHANNAITQPKELLLQDFKGKLK